MYILLNKDIIQERKRLELQRKLQSANAIRMKRNNVKLIREKMENTRKEEFNKHMNQKYERERSEFIELEHHLN